MPPNLPPRCRGAKPTSRAKLAGATPHRITGPTPPQFAVVPAQLSFWLNNIDGDCVTAEEAFAKACSSPEIFIQDSTVLAWASSHNVLNGAMLLEVIQWMQSNGFSQDGVTYNDGAPTSIDWTNAGQLTNAISQGPVKIGVAATQLEAVVGNNNGWFGTSFYPDPNLDHCVSLCGYGSISWLATVLGVPVPSGINGAAPGYLLFTWNTIGIIDVPSMVAITGEAWLRNPTTIIKGGPTPPPPPPPVPIPPPPLPPPGVNILTLASPLPAGKYVLSPATTGPDPMPQDPPIPVPTPGPLPVVPPPAPLPSPIKQQIDALFSYLETQLANRPFMVWLLHTIQSYVDANVSREHLRGALPTEAGALPPYLKSLFDTAIATAEMFFPQYAPYLLELQKLVDQYMAGKR